MCNINGWFAKESRFDFNGLDICGRPVVPLSLKVLGTLRVLGRATCFDGISELSNVSEETHRIFFHKFTRLFAQVLTAVDTLYS